MNILFLMIAFPDVEKTENLYTELAHEFKNHDHNVYVATILGDSDHTQTILRNERGVNVLRISSGKLFNVNYIVKGINTVLLPYRFNQDIKKYFKGVKFDLVISPTPPITFLNTIKKLKKKHSCKSYLILRDIFPQNAKDLGLINNELLFSYFRRKEKKLYGISDHIGCMSQGNIDYIVKHNTDIKQEKLELLPNWRKVRENSFLPKTNYRKQYGFNDDQIVLIFGGNIGLPQELDFLIELVECYKHREDITFLIIGSGNRQESLKKMIVERELTNVILKDPVPSQEYDCLVRECDIGLINLNRDFTIPNIPSKTLAYFEAEVPILASIDQNTDYGRVLNEARAGMWSITGDLESYKNNFEKLVCDKELRKSMGRNGRSYLIQNLGVNKAYKTIINHIKK
ncbi:glycosyltransferase family 4 protein [Bacillus sp. FDAARGOS_1420]|uniref:glycosyltransferase family 4 protein n=1 Tax=unclassified Bacillus (in: firmicutes) TaxID=185979 RepID=UPI001C5B3064|nr:glycosyltransferase family 4 protein [Bacillus sp. FDAARGOS_1420]MBW3496677.1 glycosyltransferase family 4 protein [Bacillus sp. FDAARGOS_1420]